MDTRIYVDGRITTPDEAVVPALDRGFLFGDSVYEVFWWHKGALIQERDHLDRLEASAARLYMDMQPTREELVEAIQETVRAAGGGPEDDAYIRLVVTRGAGPLGLDFSKAPRQSVVIVAAPANRPSEAQVRKGLSAALVDRLRLSARALDPAAKTGNYLNNILALHEARIAGADEAIMLNARGDVTEATTANVYAIHDGRLTTPSLEAGLLKGTTRTRILALCADAGIPAAESTVKPDALRDADEIFLSSSVRGILPIVTIDGQPVGSGTPGPLTLAIRERFEAAADAEARAAIPS